MEVTQLIPELVTRDFEKVKAKISGLGFEIKHFQDFKKFKEAIIEDPNGNRFVIVETQFEDVPTGLRGMRLNVRDFEEGIKTLKAFGFGEFRPVIETETAKYQIMSTVEGFKINVCYHKR